MKAISKILSVFMECKSDGVAKIILPLLPSKEEKKKKKTGSLLDIGLNTPPLLWITNLKKVNACLTSLT